MAASVVGDSLTDTDHFALLVDAVSAASSATTATTKASEAATSATNAANSASTASTQASNASTSASTASTQATNAANSATAAASSAASAATALDNFDDIFLGAKSSDPSTDNDGDALNAGDLYFNTTSNQLKVFNGSSFQTIDTFTTGISSGNVPVFTSGIADDDFLRVNGTSIEGRSASEVLSDIGASPVAGSSSIVTTGALDSGSITSGFGNIDVGSSTITTTGAITGGSLVIDNITIDGTEIDLSSGDITLDAALDIKLDAAGGDIKFLSDGTEFGEIRNISNDLTVISSVADKDIVFKGQDSSSEIEAMRIDMSSGGFVGIGTSSPDAPITIQPTAQGIGTNSVQNWMYSLSSGSEFDLKLNQIVSSGLVKHSFTLRNNGTSYSDNLVLDRGNVGIGTSSPSDLLEIQGGSADGIRISVSGQSYHHKIRTNGDGLLLSADDSGAGGAGADMRFHVAGAERVRIENDGDVLIGKTTTSILTAGIAMSNTLGIRPIVDGDVAMLAGRLSSDGEIIQFRKENTKIGRIGVASGTLFIGSAESNLRFNFGAGQAVIPATSAGASRDNVIDLGESSARFNDAFITNGVTTGSDKNEKQDIEELSEAEKKVALACKGLMRKFRWKDAVAEKGDKARTHFGIIAQDLEDAFKAEGLDASKYAMFCSDTWTNDDGKEQTRLGIRYPQLLAFIISAI